MLTAAIYARYSSQLQRATSIEDQVRLCRDAAARFGCDAADAHLYTDEELSGAIGHRPGYQRLLDAARRRMIEAVIVESQDRLWRNQGEMHAALERLTFWGVRVFTVTGGTDLTDRTGRLLASVSGWKDEMFLADLKEKTRRGLRGVMSRGLSVGGRAYGYRSEPVQDETGRVIGYRRVVDPDEADVVRRIFRLYVQGLTPRAIAHRLNSDRVPSPRPSHGQVRRGWTPSTIAGSVPKATGILSNPIYVGRVVWNRSEKLRDPDTGRRIMRMRPASAWVWKDVPALRIVSDDLWREAQARRGQRRVNATGSLSGRRPVYLLSGLLVCAECNSRYIVQVKKRSGDRYYGCASHVDRGPTICTNGRLVRQAVIEQRTLDYLFGDLLAPHRFAYLCAAVDERLARASSRPEALLRRLTRQQAEAQAELEHIAEAIRHGILTPTTRTMLEDAERRVSTLAQGIAEVRRRPAPVVSAASSIHRYVTDLRATLATNPDKARRLLARGVRRIVLRRDGQRLWADLEGDLAGVLGLEDTTTAPRWFGNHGAGRGIHSESHGWPWTTRIAS